MNDFEEILSCDLKCSPLSSIDEVLNFGLSDINKNLIKKYCIDLIPHFKACGPQVFISHDYKGGYNYDAYIKGSNNKNEFSFYHWHLIDIFNYFSHEFITIPPIPWIYLAHKNGVKIIGTIIVENDDGLNKIEYLLKDLTRINNFSKCVAEIMKSYNFDGWFLNIEVSIDKSFLKNLIVLVDKIKKECYKLNKDSIIIWYDSIVYPKGNCCWQNELNELNEIFFDFCDGIFLNYFWSIKNLEKSLRSALKKNRLNDVYVGIDVHGRGTYKNGGWNTYEAIKCVEKFKLSIGIFAPGWVQENLDPNEFPSNNKKFWNSLNLPIKNLIKKLPIETSFCQGIGNHFYKNGSVLYKNSWSNLLMQQTQPSFNFNTNDFNNPYEGGSCLVLSDFDVPIFKLMVNWDYKIIVQIIYRIEFLEKETSSELIIIGHGSKSVSISKNLKENKLFKNNPNDKWKFISVSLENEERKDKFLEKIYLYPNTDEKVLIKIGYMKIFNEI